MAQAAPHPRMHGLTHVPGGSDPVPGLLPSTADVVIAPGYDALWKLDETSGTVAHDASGNGWDLQVPASHIAPVWGAAAGPPGTLSAQFVPAAADAFARTSSPAFPAYSADFTAAGWVNLSDSGADVHYLMGQGDPLIGGGLGWALLVGGSSTVPVQKVFLAFNDGVGAETTIVGTNTLPLGVWTYLAVVRQSGVFKLFVNALQETATSAAAYSAQTGFKIGDLGNLTGESPYNLHGLASWFAVWPRALSTDELNGLTDNPAGTVPAGAAGEVLTIGPDGNPVWGPPGIEVTHGDGTPDATPIPGPPPSSFTGTPANPSGWHLQAHVETAVLYDSSPGRFDVPTLSWTRVPFNTVRIWRTWETTVNGPTKTAWLDDDRGLTVSAKQGFLHITAGMQGTPDGFGVAQQVTGWYALEYPIVQYTGLPRAHPDAFDDYVRSARFVNLSTGTVLRAAIGSSNRALFVWPFPQPADGDVGQNTSTVDNPFPIYLANYPGWTRPLHLPLPYPAMSPTESRAHYLSNETLFPVFDTGKFQVPAALTAGANICLQAWQDTPYTLQFSTDHFANYKPGLRVEPWGQRPHLAITYTYNPDEIDHTTGKRPSGT